jgi:single-stranded DNA-binding protein
MNRITLAGRLTKDVELADMGSSVLAKTSIAVNERKKKGDEWVNGRLDIRKYERKDGTGTGIGISVKVDDFTFGPKNENKNSASGGFGNSDAPF